MMGVMTLTVPERPTQAVVLAVTVEVLMVAWVVVVQAEHSQQHQVAKP